MSRSDGGDNERRNVQLLCGYCNRVKGTQGRCGHRLKMPELRADNVAAGVMVDQQLAEITGRRLAQHHRVGFLLQTIIPEAQEYLLDASGR